jgi:hypothetical protein
MAELVRWIKEELREDESILVFVHNPRFVQQIVGWGQVICGWMKNIGI